MFVYRGSSDPYFHGSDVNIYLLERDFVLDNIWCMENVLDDKRYIYFRSTQNINCKISHFSLGLN